MPIQNSHVIPGGAPLVQDVTDIMSPTNHSRRQGVASRQPLYLFKINVRNKNGILNKLLKTRT